jgi:hypothetical protein
MLHNVAHNVCIRNVKVSKRERHMTYSVTKRTASQNVKCTLRYETNTLCAATFCNFTSCDVYAMLLYNM